MTAPLATTSEWVPTPEPRRFGDYELFEVVAHGGMGLVYRARQISLNRIVAVKMILAAQMADEQTVRRFQTEAEAAAKLRHPNIVAIHVVGVEQGQHFYSMDFVAGQSLGQIVREYPLPPRRAATYVRSVAEAIHYAHQQGVLHRDLKPSNVLIDTDDQPRVTDFGLAKVAHDDSGLTLSGQVMGTPSYMAPEQAQGHGDKANARTDVYGLGALLYELLTGHPPFKSESPLATLKLVIEAEPVPPRQVNPKVPLDLETICLKCLRKNPARRYGNAQELAEDLRRYLAHEPIQARPIGALGKGWRWCRRKPAVAALSAATVVLLLTVTLGSVLAAWRIGLAKDAAVRTAAESRERLRRLNVSTGIGLMEAGDLLGALPWLVQALGLEQPGTDSDRLARLRIATVLHEAPKLVQLWTMPDLVEEAPFGPDGKHVIGLTKTGRVFLWEVSSGACLATSSATQEPVHRLRLSPRGDRLALVHQTAGVSLCQVPSLAQVCSLGQGRRIRDAAFSPDGRVLVTVTGEGEVERWDGVTGTDLHSSWPAGLALDRLHFSPDGQRLLLVQDSQAWLCDAATGRLWQPTFGHGGKIVDAAFSPDGSRLLTASQDRTARLWPVAPAPGEPLSLEHGSWVTAAQFSGDGRYVVTASYDRTARVWLAQTGQAVTPPLRHGHAVWRASFSPDGRYVLTAGFDHTARLWNVQTGEPVLSTLRHNGYVAEASFSPEGRRLVTAGQDHVVRVWELSSTLSTWSAEAPGSVEAMDFSPDGTRLVSANSDGTVQLRAAASGRLLATQHQEADLTCVRFSPDGHLVVTVGRTGSAQLCDAQTGQPLRPAMRHERAILCANFSPDSRRLVTASEDRTAQVWDTATGQPVGPRLPHGRTVRWAGFSPDGTKLATVSKDGRARVWDAATGTPLGPPLEHGSELYTAAFSPDGTKLATACSDDSFEARAAYLWDWATGRQLTPPLPHSDGVRSLAFSPDGQRLATGGEDAIASVWDTTTGRRLAQPMRHQYHVLTVRFSTNGLFLFTVGADGTARLWEAATGEPVTPPLRHGHHVFCGQMSQDARLLGLGGDAGSVQVWVMPRESRSQAQLRQLSELLTGQRLDPDAGPTPLNLSELLRARQELAAAPLPAPASEPTQRSEAHLPFERSAQGPSLDREPEVRPGASPETKPKERGL